MCLLKISMKWYSFHFCLEIRRELTVVLLGLWDDRPFITKSGVSYPCCSSRCSTQWVSQPHCIHCRLENQPFSCEEHVLEFSPLLCFDYTGVFRVCFCLFALPVTRIGEACVNLCQCQEGKKFRVPVVTRYKFEVEGCVNLLLLPQARSHDLDREWAHNQMFDSWDPTTGGSRLIQMWTIRIPGYFLPFGSPMEITCRSLTFDSARLIQKILLDITFSN